MPRMKICSCIRAPSAIVAGAMAAPLNAWDFLLGNHTDAHIFIVQCPEDRLCPVDMTALRKALAAKIARVCDGTRAEERRLCDWLFSEEAGTLTGVPQPMIDMAAKYTFCEVDSVIDSAAHLFLGKSRHPILPDRHRDGASR